MNQKEFIERLIEALEGEVPPQVIQSNVQFYQDYIRDEICKGRTEEEVMEELGDPRIIARTIFDSQEAVHGKYGEPYTYNEDGGGEYETVPVERSSNQLTTLWDRIRPMVILAGIVVVGLAILSALFSVAAAVLTTPVFWVILAILILVKAKF